MTFTFNSCDLAQTNIDPTRQIDVDMNLILPTAISQTAYNQSALPARMPGIIMQQFIGFDAQQVSYTDYLITRDEFNNYWNFGLYAGALKDCDVIINKAMEDGQIHYEAIAKVLMAYNYGMAAMMFGDIPFSEALQGLDNLKPAYDTQEEVYTGVQQLLDEAITLLGQDGPEAGPAADDLIYGGEPASWLATAHALKARFHLHLSKRDPDAYNKVLSELGMAFTGLDGQPDFAWENSLNAACPLAAFGIERSNTMNIDDRFFEWMNSKNDPRIESYMEPAINADGDTTGWVFHQTGNSDLYWAQNNTVVPLISFVELEFMRAEALLMTGASDADVEAALESGIAASMQQIGIDSAAYGAYVAAQADLSSFNNREDKLAHIIEEAYTSFYGHAFLEVWNNYRRTGYPALTPSPNGTNGLNPGGGIPRRFPLPVDESTTNSANFQAALERQNGGLMDVDTWANE
jgi:hypothetical protein